ncbi:MAG TPA: hypothetical protein VIS77_07015 [Burkholderiales bacterium]
MRWLDSDAERRAQLEAHRDDALVSAALPLRANLSVLENIALVPQVLLNLDEAAAVREALELLARAGCEASAHRRDAELGHEERFVAKVLRAAVGRPARIVIERPGLMLPDTHYPPFVDSVLAVLADRLAEVLIMDYSWNRKLYPPQ